MPGRSGAMMRKPRSVAIESSGCRRTRELPKPWKNRTGTPPWRPEVVIAERAAVAQADRPRRPGHGGGWCVV